MKKSMKLLALFATVATLAVSCEKELNNEGTDNSDLTAAHITFTAAAPQTRTAFDAKDAENTYPTLWQEGDQVHIWNDKTPRSTYSIPVADMTPAASGKTATFVLSMERSTRYFSVHPVGTADWFDNEELDLSVPRTQTPTADSCDSEAMIIFSDSGDVSSNDTEIILSYQHVTAYGKFSIVNLDENAGEVSYIELESSEKWTGTVEVHYKEAEFRRYDSAAYTDLTINTSSTENIWFACIPVDLSDSSLKITVYTKDSKTYTRDIDLTDKTLKFEAGVVSEFKVDMAGVSAN